MGADARGEMTEEAADSAADSRDPREQQRKVDAWHLIMPWPGEAKVSIGNRLLEALDLANPIPPLAAGRMGQEVRTGSLKDRRAARAAVEAAARAGGVAGARPGRSARRTSAKRRMEAARERLRQAIRKVLARKRAQREARRLFAARFVQYAARRRMANRFHKTETGWRLNLHADLLAEHPRCMWGLALASEADFAKQRAEAEAVLDHWSKYLLIHRRLAKRAFIVGDLYAAEGGAHEGIRRLGAEGRALDKVLYQAFVDRFGTDHLVIGDATDEQDVRRLGEVDGYWASPPCQSASSMPGAGAGFTASKETQLLPATRAMLDRLGKPYVLENVMGAYSYGHMRKDVCLTNHMFGLRAYRPRVFEGSFPLRNELDARWLTKQCCLGSRNRMPRRDRFGRRRVCCGGNHHAVYSSRTKGVTTADWEAAMGMEAGHMTDRGLALSIPPQFAMYLIAQMCAQALAGSAWGVPLISYEEARDDEGKRRLLERYVSGIGPLDPAGAMASVPALREGDPPVGGGGDGGVRCRPCSVQEGALHPGAGEAAAAAVGAAAAGTQTGDETTEAPGESGRAGEQRDARPDADSEASGAETDEEDPPPVSSRSKRRAAASERRQCRKAERGGSVALSDSELSVLYNADGGWFDQWASDGKGVDNYISNRLRTDPVCCARLGVAGYGHNTLVLAEAGALGGWVDQAAKALALQATMSKLGEPERTQVTFVVPDDDRGAARGLLKAMGARVLHRWEPGNLSDPELSKRGATAWAVGRHAVALPATPCLTDEQVDALRDPRDTGEQPVTPEFKWWFRNQPMPLDAATFAAEGFSDATAEMLAAGCNAPVEQPEPERRDFGSYPEHAPGDYWDVAREMRRAELRGAIKYVAESEAHYIHPFVVVHQKGKVRVCMDCSVGLNKLTSPWKFCLPRIWDLAKWVTKDSWFSKFDLADGFYAVPIAEGSQKWFGIRHPEVCVPEPDQDPEHGLPYAASEGLTPGQRHPRSGQVAVYRKLPFGWNLSPARFVQVTEELAQILRKKYGLKVVAYIDDFGIVSDSYEQAVRDRKIFESVCARLGLQLAPWKSAGPTQSFEFLGLRISNLPGFRTVGLPANKLANLTKLLDNFANNYRPGSRAHPKDLAQLLGQLNFAAQVVEGSSVFLDRMYAQFRGVLVDWKRGLVRIDGRREHLVLRKDFFEDVAWWRTNLRYRHTVPIRDETAQEPGVISGTDASDWGKGQAIWLSGEREIFQHVFTEAEKRHPINFRELAGCVRILEQWGPRLRGRRLILETDNMAAMWAIRRGRARTGAMAEQLRRLFTMAAQWGVKIKIMHTRGVDLLLPDAVSRYRMPVPARQRLSWGEYNNVDSEYGPFEEGIGAEMEHRLPARKISTAPAERTLWLHPSHHCIADTLKLMWKQVDQSRMTERSSGGRPVVGAVLLPDWPGAAWRGLVDGLRVARRWPTGANILEEWRGGARGWTRVRTITPTVLYLFPACADMKLRPLGRGQFHAVQGDIVAWPVELALRGTAGNAKDKRYVLPLFEALLQPVPESESESELDGRRSSDGTEEAAQDEGDDEPFVREHFVWCRPLILARGRGKQTGEDTYGPSPRATGKPRWVDRRQAYRVTEWAEIGATPKGALRVKFDADRWDALWLAERAKPEPELAALCPAADGVTSVHVGRSGDDEDSISCVVCDTGLQGRPAVEITWAGAPGPLLVHAECEAEARAMVVEPPPRLAPTPPVEGSVVRPVALAPKAKGGGLLVLRHRAQLAADPKGGNANTCMQCGDDCTHRSADYVSWANTPVGGWVHSRCLRGYGDRRPTSPVRSSGTPEPKVGETPEPRGPTAAKRSLSPAGSSGRRTPQLPGADPTPGPEPKVRKKLGLKPPSKAGGKVAIRSGSRGVPDSNRGMAGPQLEAPVVTGFRALKSSGPGNTREAQRLARCSEQRLRPARACWAGFCGCDEPRDLRCIGCEATGDCDMAVHSRCWGCAGEVASAAAFICPKCRVASLSLEDGADEGELEEEATRAAVEAVAGLSPGTVRVMATIRAHAAECTRLRKVKDLFDSAAGLKFFGSYLLDKGLAPSVDLYVRIGGLLGCLDRRGGEDFSRSKAVRKWLKHSVKGGYGGDGDGMSPLPLCMFVIALRELAAHASELIGTRDATDLTMEFQGGARIGEACGGGDIHGWECGAYTRMYRDRTEVRFDHTKQGDSREFVTLAHDTERSGLHMGEQLVKLAGAWNRKIVSARADTGERYDYIDYAVVRVSLDGLTSEEMKEVLGMLARAPETTEQKVQYLETEAWRRRAEGVDGMRYINVSGGTEARMELVERWWSRQQLSNGEKLVCSVNPGPMLAATCGRGFGITDMPIRPGSMGPRLKEALTSAYEEMLEVDDPEHVAQCSGLAMNLNGPRWHSHSARRGGCKLAREGSAPKELIDAHFRWGAASERRTQQVKYASLEEAGGRKSVTIHF